MITLKDFMRITSMENTILHAQTADLSHEDALIQPGSGANCMNWVLGHMLQNQIALLEKLGGNAPKDAAGTARYATGSEPVTCDGPDVMPLEKLIGIHDLVHSSIMAEMIMKRDADFEEEIEIDGKKATLGWYAFFYQFHFDYHLGQLEQLRALTGKTEKAN